MSKRQNDHPRASEPADPATEPHPSPNSPSADFLCAACGTTFHWTSAELRFLTALCLDLPRLCLLCRARKQAADHGPLACEFRTSTTAARGTAVSAEVRLALDKLQRGCPLCGRTAGARVLGKRVGGEMRFLRTDCDHCRATPRRSTTVPTRSAELLDDWRRFDRALTTPPTRMTSTLAAPSAPAWGRAENLRRPTIRVSRYEWHG